MEDITVAERFVGALGEEGAEDEVGVADASDDAAPVPTELIAEIR